MSTDKLKALMFELGNLTHIASLEDYEYMFEEDYITKVQIDVFTSTFAITKVKAEKVREEIITNLKDVLSIIWDGSSPNLSEPFSLQDWHNLIRHSDISPALAALGIYYRWWTLSQNPDNCTPMHIKKSLVTKGDIKIHPTKKFIDIIKN